MGTNSSPAIKAPALLEREFGLEALDNALADATAGRGRLVLVGGEAGVGKTALVRHFCEAHRGSARILWGACDALFTPRPLGAFLEVAQVTGGKLEGVVRNGGKPHDVVAVLVDQLAERGTILVLDDVHWADEATLDILRLLGRRIADVPALVIVAYRDDLDRAHPLRIVFGELATARGMERLTLASLSPPAVVELAEPYGVDAEELYRRTGGNPFFVTEVLAGPEGEIPPTVRDAVLARAARLSPAARRLLEAVAVAAPQAELWLLEALANDSVAHLDECLSSGMLISVANAIAFRHEVARLAIEESIAPDRELALHRAALAALTSPPHGAPDLARLAHHADVARDAEAVLRFAPAAAERAASLGAHREAAAQYARALRFAGDMALDGRAGLSIRHSLECFFTTQEDDAFASTERAIECYEQLGDRLRHGDALRWRAQMQLARGFAPAADATARDAVALLEQLPPGHELAMTYGVLAAAAMLAEDVEETIAWATRAISLAKRLGDTEAYVAALGTVGALEGLRGSPEGRPQLERSLALAEEAGLENQMARHYVLLGMTASRERSLDLMERYVRPAVAFCDERDLDVWGGILLAMRSWIELERGEWDAATATTSLVLSQNCTLSRAQAHIVLGLLRARRGDPDPWTPLAQAGEIAELTGQLWWTSQVAAARAEAAWIEGRPDVVAEATEAPLALARQKGSPWPIAELAYWRQRAGIEERIPSDAGGPFAFQLRGEWEKAAELWRKAGCPYEAALALAETNDEESLRRALDELQRLGALPASRLVTRRLRALGARGLTRGPRRETRENPAGITARELDVVRLVAQGLRNAEIADRLFLSSRTVDHHVSAILRKLGATTRGEATAAARRLGVVQDT